MLAALLMLGLARAGWLTALSPLSLTMFDGRTCTPSTGHPPAERRNRHHRHEPPAGPDRPDHNAVDREAGGTDRVRLP